MKKRRPTIKQIEDLSFALHCEGIEYCLAAHTDGSDTSNGFLKRGKSRAYKDASERIRALIEPPKKESKP